MEKKKMFYWVPGVVVALTVSRLMGYVWFWEILLPLLPLSVLLFPKLRRRWWVVTLAVLLSIGMLPEWVFPAWVLDAIADGIFEVLLLLGF